MKVRSDLLMRLHAIHNYFFSQWRQIPLYRYPTPPPMQPLPEAEITPIESGESSSGSGGGSNPYAEEMDKIIAKGKGQSLKDLVPPEEEESDESGGGGTMTGLRVEKTPKLSMGKQ